MDIVTHAAIGLIAAGAVIDQPAMAVGILAGSVVPDLDVISRVLGKRAMLRAHQTASHSLPVLALIALLIAATPLGAPGGLGFFLGAALHVMLDYTNTLGVTLLWPFVQRRLQVGWVFFIDAFVMMVTFISAALTLMWIWSRVTPSTHIASGTALVLFVYWMIKAWLLRRAKKQVGAEVVSIIPSALIPWHFYLCSRSGSRVSVLLLNIASGGQRTLSTSEIVDDEVKGILHQVPEWHLMRGLSPAYHAIRCESSGEGLRISCRDLRIRNFKSTFGDLDVFVNSEGNLIKTHFHV